MALDRHVQMKVLWVRLLWAQNHDDLILFRVGLVERYFDVNLKIEQLVCWLLQSHFRQLQTAL